MEDGGHLQELLETLESGVLSLDRDREADPLVSIHRIFQSAHNLKSGLAMAGLNRASKLFHGLEDGLDEIRRGRQPWSADWADAVLDAVDLVRACLDVGHDGGVDPRFQPPCPLRVDPAFALRPDERSASLEASALGLRLFRIEKFFLPGLTREEFEGHLIYDDIRERGTLVSVQPGWAEYSQATSEVIVKFLFRSAQTLDQLSELFFDPLMELPLPLAPTGVPPQFNLLVVDDDRTTASVIKKALEPYGPVTVAYEGTEALKAFQQAFPTKARFDVIVLDLEMPELDGHGTLQALREYEESHGILGLDRCLVFINTSNNDLRKVKASFRLQADRYFLKPLSVDLIKKRLEESLPWLETRRREVS